MIDLDEKSLQGLNPKTTASETNHIDSYGANMSQEHFQHLPIIAVEPKRCKPWSYHNRDEAWLTRENCQDLINSIQQSGQLEPILVRPIKNAPNYDYETIYGVRRWFACSQIPNQKLLARITDADDKTCMILMHVENATSRDITDFERAFSFAQQIKSGIFKNQAEMAEMLGLTQGYISKLINAGAIFEYSWIKALFQNKLNIPLKYAYELSILLKKPHFYEQIKLEAEAIFIEKQKRGVLPAPVHILKRLIHVCKTQMHFTGKAILLNADLKTVVSCSKNKTGKLTIYIEKEAKDLDPIDIEVACLKALQEHVFK